MKKLKSVGVILGVLSFFILTGSVLYSRVDKNLKVENFQISDKNVEESISKKIKPFDIYKKLEPKVYAEKLEKPNIVVEFKELENKVKEVSNQNILFLGNSLIEGLHMVNEQDNDFICKVGVSLKEYNYSYLPRICNYNNDTVVIEMGTNELGIYSEEEFKAEYSKLVGRVRENNLDVSVVCMSIPPLSENRSNQGDRINNDNVRIYNGYIRELAEELDMYHIDNSEFFGEVLDSSLTKDGIHLSADGYRMWYDFIKSSEIFKENKNG